MKPTYGDQLACIGLLVGNPVDRGLLAQFLRECGHETVEPDSFGSLEPLARAGLLIVDETAARRHAAQIQAMKREAAPLVLPTLVLVNRNSDGTFWIRQGFEDVLRQPLAKVELMARLEAYLRLRLQSENALRDGEERFRVTFDHAPSGIAHTALDGRFLMVNRRLCEILGYPEAELLQKRFTEITYADDLDTTLSHRQALIAGQRSEFQTEKRYVHKDGTVIWADLTVSVVRGGRGEPKQFISIINDISGRKQLEDKVHRIARARRVMAECNRILVHAPDESTLLTRMCAAAVEFGGYALAWVGMAQHDAQKSVRPVARAGRHTDYVDWTRVTWDASDPNGRGAMGRAIRTGELTLVEDAASDPTQAPWREQILKRGFHSALVLPLKVDGTTVGGMAIFGTEAEEFSPDECELMRELAADIGYGMTALRDRIARQQAELSLRESERFARATIDALSKHICVLDEHGIIIAVNRAWREFAARNGNPDRDCVAEGSNYLEICERAADSGDPDARQVAAALRALIAGSRSDYTFEYRCDSDTEQRWFLLKASVFPDGGPRRLVVSHEDISQRKRSELALLASEERFRDLAELSSDWYWEQDESYRFIEMSGFVLGKLWPNQAFSIGKSRREMHELEPSRYYVGLTEADWQANQALIEERQPFRDQIFQHRTADGQAVYTSISGKPVFDEQGRFRGYRGTGRDITAQLQSRKDLMVARERMRFLLSATPAVIYAGEVDPPYAVNFISDNVRNHFGYAPDDLIDTPGFWFDHVHADDRERVASELDRACQVGHGSLEYRFRRVDGSYVWVRDEPGIVRGTNGAQDELVGYMIDVTEKKHFEDQLLHLAHYDRLTELPNRVLFQDRLIQTLAQAQRNDWIAGVMFLDLDRFKVVNDTLGHHIGDELLRGVSERLGECVRAGDTVGRLGGDEFAVILSDLSKTQDARLVAEKIMRAFDQPFRLEGREIFVTPSIGITLYPADATAPDELIKYADTAMYRAKELGRSNYQFYTADMNSRSLERLDLEYSLRRALERNEFLLHYQPKVEVKSGEMTGMEALVRWQRPGAGLVSPADFIPLLEETGLIVPVGEWVLRSACGQIKKWQAAGLRPLPVAVNISARQMQNAGLLEMVRGVLAETGVDPGLLELEITESSLMHNTESAVTLLQALKDLGLRLSIDDFGTGYSSLSYLKRFPVDALKIDRSFVRDVNTDRDDAAISRAIITMAHQLDLKVIAEGVEDRMQQQFLVENGCDEAQGFLFSRPVNADAIAAMLHGDRVLRAVA